MAQPPIDYRAKLLELDAIIHPENYPRELQPDHLYWDGRDDDEGGPDFPFQWSADTIEWVSSFLARTLAGESEFRPITEQDERSADERRADAGVMTDTAIENGQCPECGNATDDNGDNYVEVHGAPYGRPEVTNIAAHRSCIAKRDEVPAP